MQWIVVSVLYFREHGFVNKLVYRVLIVFLQPDPTLDGDGSPSRPGTLASFPDYLSPRPANGKLMVIGCKSC